MHLDSDTHKRDSDFSVRKNCCSFYTISIKFIDPSSGKTYNTNIIRPTVRSHCESIGGATSKLIKAYYTGDAHPLNLTDKNTVFTLEITKKNCDPWSKIT